MLGWGCANKFYGLEKNVGGGGGGYAKIFYAFEKNVGGGGYAQIFYGLEKNVGGVMPKYFMDLKKCWGVENVWGYANKFCLWI